MPRGQVRQVATIAHTTGPRVTRMTDDHSVLVLTLDLAFATFVRITSIVLLLWGIAPVLHSTPEPRPAYHLLTRTRQKRAMEQNPDGDQITALFDQFRRVEERLERIETYLDIKPEAEPVPAEGVASDVGQNADGEALEFELGQNWFAKLGIVVVAIGFAFALTFPYNGLPPALPGIVGVLIAVAVFSLAHIWRSSFVLVSSYLRGAALALLYFSALRLSFFGQETAIVPGSVAAISLMIAVTAITTFVSLRRGSAYLTALALSMGYVTLIVADNTLFTLGGLTVLAVFVAFLGNRFEWGGIILYGIVLTYLTDILWAFNNPLLGHRIAANNSTPANIIFLLLYAVIFAVGTILRKDRATESGTTISSGFLNGGGAYGVLLLLTLIAFRDMTMPAHLLACAVLLVLATTFWIREESKYSTFVYAMLGYSALSVAILKASTPPGVFVWLSLQSIVVVVTAIWFRSRFIVVANFFIYLCIMAGYLFTAPQESGISLVFGFVGLLSARILNWQRDRLELKTELMRNAYLALAFLVFPYALYHLVPEGYIALSWVGIAMFYYIMNLLVRKQKYRWMGHLTLVLTVFYVVFVGLRQLEPTYRIVSLLVLGVVLIAVSLFFTRLKSRKRTDTASTVETPP